MKQLEVQIMGQSYLLGCPEGGESRLLDAVERVDTAMCKIREGGKVRARDRIAVLAALNLAFDLADHSEAQANVPEPALPATAAPDTSARDQPADDNPLLSALLGRLDQALGDESQLS